VTEIRTIKCCNSCKHLYVGIISSDYHVSCGLRIFESQEHYHLRDADRWVVTHVCDLWEARDETT